MVLLHPKEPKEWELGYKQVLYIIESFAYLLQMIEKEIRAYLPSSRSIALLSVSAGWSKLSEIKTAALVGLRVEPALMMFWRNNVSDGEENDLQQT